MVESPLYSKPGFLVPMKYHKILFTAVQHSLVDLAQNHTTMLAAHGISGYIKATITNTIQQATNNHLIHLLIN